MDRRGRQLPQSGALQCAPHTDRQAAAGEQEVPPFLPCSRASSHQELRAHQPPASETCHRTVPSVVRLWVAAPEQKWALVEAPSALADICYLPSPLIARCEVVLGEFLKEIKKNPSSVKFAEMANILVIHCQTTGECVKAPQPPPPPKKLLSVSGGVLVGV